MARPQQAPTQASDPVPADSFSLSGSWQPNATIRNPGSAAEPAETPTAHKKQGGNRGLHRPTPNTAIPAQDVILLCHSCWRWRYFCTNSCRYTSGFGAAPARCELFYNVGQFLVPLALAFAASRKHVFTTPFANHWPTPCTPARARSHPPEAEAIPKPSC